MPFIRKQAIFKHGRQKFIMAAIPIAFAFVGSFMDRLNNERYRDYHNRSSLYGGKKLGPGERSW